jgi:hypothetical protein
MRRLLPVALLLVVVSAHAQVYKWKDASGTVHYSDAPPPAGAEYKSVKTTGTAEPLAAPAAAPAAASTAGKATPPIADTPQNRAAVCKTLQGNMSMLSGDGALTMDDGKGKAVAMDPTRRRQEQTLAQEQYKQYCSK